jgi:WD40 repeat protein
LLQKVFRRKKISIKKTMSIDNYCINFDEEGTQLRLLAPNNKTSVGVHEMLGNPFGTALFTIRNLGHNPAYESTGNEPVASSSAPKKKAPASGSKAKQGAKSGSNEYDDDEDDALDDTRTLSGQTAITSITSRNFAATSSGKITSSAAPVTSGALDFAGNTLGATTKVDRITATPDCTLIAVGSERILRIVTADTKTVAAEIWMEEKILNLRCNSSILAVMLSKATHFFHLETLQPLPELRTQWPNLNHNGLGALSCMLGMSCFFAVSQSLSDKKLRGDVFLYNPISASTLTVVDAHEEPIRCVEFCGNGTRFATVSNHGRKIRIWSCPDCTPIYELQRGSSEAVIYSIAMNYDATILALTSNSGTLHLFKPQQNNRSIGKINGRTTPSLCFVSPDGMFLYVLYPPDANSKTAKLERHKLSFDLKTIEADNEINLTV